MIEIPVGEFVTRGEEVYKCIEYSGADACLSCDFWDTIDYCESVHCNTGMRLDNKGVFFILYDNISEAYCE